MTAHNKPPALNIVLIHPEIPQNTGTIGRACLAVGAKLHLVHPLGFDADTKAVKRAGLDYWEHIQVVHHASLDDFISSIPDTAEKFLIETRSGRTIYNCKFTENAYLIFGCETTGLPEWYLQKESANLARIPMWDARVRSLNLSNSVSIALYEAVRQLTI